MTHAEPAAPEAIDNRHFVLILQHPQERREALSTAAATCAALQRAALRVGLSWPNLAHALGCPADPRRWAVLYLGAMRPGLAATGRELVALGRDGEPAADQDEALRGLAGIVVLDGTWKEAKTLWWRNPWLLKLRRIVLLPRQPSRYGRLRREPRREALSTIEAVALVLRQLEGDAGIEAALLGRLDRLITAVRPSARRGGYRRSSVNYPVPGGRASER